MVFLVKLLVLWACYHILIYRWRLIDVTTVFLKQCFFLQPDFLLGFLDSLDPEMFLSYADSDSTCLEKLEEEICGETNSIPTASSPPLGSPSAKLEAINELIRFDHVYTKPLILEIPVKMGNQTNMLVKIEDVSLPSSEDKAVPEVPVSVKEEPVDSFMPELGISHLLSSHHSPAASSYLLDAHSDSGYEGSLSPFSDLSSPLDVDHTWEDSFANELFPQLISVWLSSVNSPQRTVLAR